MMMESVTGTVILITGLTGDFFYVVEEGHVGLLLITSMSDYRPWRFVRRTRSLVQLSPRAATCGQHGMPSLEGRPEDVSLCSLTTPTASRGTSTTFFAGALLGRTPMNRFVEDFGCMT
jgi:hypothetical protein